MKRLMTRYMAPISTSCHLYAILLTYLLMHVHYSTACYDNIGSFCEIDSQKNAVTYSLQTRSNGAECTDTSDSCTSIAEILTTSCASQQSVIKITIAPGIYYGSDQMIDLTQCETITSLALVCTTAYMGNSDCAFIVNDDSTFLINPSERSQLNGFSLEGISLINASDIIFYPTTVFLLFRNISCVYIVNCTFSAAGKPFIQAYNSGGNLQSTRFYINSPPVNLTRRSIGQLALVYWNDVCDEQSCCLGISNLSFIYNNKQIFKNYFKVFDIYFENINSNPTIDSLFKLSRLPSLYPACLFAFLPNLITSIKVRNTSLQINYKSNQIGAHFQYLEMDDCFSTIHFLPNSNITVEDFNWAGGLLFSEATLLLNGSNTWTCNIEDVCVPNLRPSHYGDPSIINYGTLSISGSFIPHTYTILSIVNYGTLSISDLSLIVIERLINYGTLIINGSLPYVNYFSQSLNGQLIFYYKESTPLLTSYTSLNGHLHIHLVGFCPHISSNIVLIHSFSIVTNLTSITSLGLNYLINTTNQHLTLDITAVDCSYLSCNCSTCISNSSCVFCENSNQCLTEDSPSLAQCSIKNRKNCCPNDCYSYPCNSNNDCSCPFFMYGFDCGSIQWWVFALLVVVSVMLIGAIGIPLSYRCWKSATKRKLKHLREQLDEQHALYIEKIRNREVPINLIVEYNELKIKRLIGEGSFGLVYEARWRNNVVAVKKIRVLANGLSPEEKEIFEQEAAIMCKLLHPNIVLLMAVCTEPPNLCLVTEFMQIGSVRDLLDDNSTILDWKIKLIMAIDAAKGMCYLHSVSPPVIHRDLKTANLLVDHNWKVKVSDFGVAKMMKDIDYRLSLMSSNSLVDVLNTGDEITTAESSPLLHHQAEQNNTTCAGSIRWCAPETMKPKQANTVYGQKVDIYSYGIILWELATGEWPYPELKFDFQVMEYVLQGERPPIPDNAPSQYITLLQDCWNQNPRYRPWFADIVNILQDMNRFFN